MKNRNIVLFGAGRFVSLIGTNMYQFAAGLYVLQLTGSGTKFALTLILGTLPRVIAAPIAGVLADRVNRKHVAVLTDLLSGLLLAGLWMISMFGSITVNQIYVSMVFLSIFNTFFDISIEAAKPEIVETESALERLNAISYGIFSFTSIAGPVLGGLAYAMVPFRTFVLINGVSFILSGVSESFIRFRVEEEFEKKDKDPFVSALLEGIRYLKDNPFSISLMTFSISINFCLTLAITVPLPYMFNTVLKMTSTWVGIVTAGFPVGYLLGTVIIQSRGVKRRGQAFKMGSIGVLTGKLVLVAILVLSGRLMNEYVAGMTTAAMAIIGLSIAYIDIPLMTFMQSAIPSRVRGRVFSVMTMASRVAIPLAMIVSGKLLNMLHPAIILTVGTFMYAMVLALLSGSVYLREYVRTSTIVIE